MDVVPASAIFRLIDDCAYVTDAAKTNNPDEHTNTLFIFIKFSPLFRAFAAVPNQTHFSWTKIRLSYRFFVTNNSQLPIKRGQLARVKNNGSTDRCPSGRIAVETLNYQNSTGL